MGRREQFTVGELTITKGIKAGTGSALSKIQKSIRYVPAQIVANRYVVSVEMGNKAYTIANSGLPGDGLAHNVTCYQTAVDTEDTNGKLTIVGQDVAGKIISEEIIPNAGATVAGTKAFKKITSITGSGWAQGGTGPDTIVVGFGELCGFPDKIATETDVLLVVFNNVVVAGTIAHGATVADCTITGGTADGSKVLVALYQV